MRLLIAMLLSAGLLGCATTSSNTPAYSAPDWWLNPPLDSQDALYGSGEGFSLEQARQAALNNIAGKLSTQISSSLSRHSQQVNARSSDTVDRQVRSYVAQINLSNFERLKTEQLDKRVFVLIKVDRLALIRRWQEELRQQRMQVEQVLADSRSRSRFTWWLKANSLIGLAKKADDTSLLLLALTPDKSETADLQEKLHRAIQDGSQKISTRIRGDRPSLTDSIKVQVTNEGLSYDDCRRSCDLELRYRTDIRYLNVFDETVAKLQFHGQVFDTKGELSEVRWEISGASISGPEGAKRSVIALAKNKIEEEGIWSAFAVTVP
ncbi:hypothetical protein HNR62_002873 [Oceanisphaera litoralis]|uniref:LPP20 family lipoprotein n=1 Tax=Oceanisphaera litoralis TaxID=225144 RepID=UPI00195ABD48|nr:LPP20 family lipoprotein [Oceanisphaera litoralis]MBM7456971.1 hypothetical protein [Oceanisphaera litoralis]